MLLKLPISESKMLKKLTLEAAGRNGECGSLIAFLFGLTLRALANLTFKSFFDSMNFINYQGTPTLRRGRSPNPLFSLHTVKFTTLYVPTRSCAIHTSFYDDSGADPCPTCRRSLEWTDGNTERIKRWNSFSETEAAAPKLNS